VHTYLPSSFLPGLRDGAPELSLDGASSELDFPRIEDDSIELKALPSRLPGKYQAGPGEEGNVIQHKLESL
jgi:hypothetical protein